MTTSAQTVAGVLSVCGSLWTLSLIAVVLRFYTRRRQRLAICADDLLALAALILFLGAVSIVFRECHIGSIGWTMDSLTEEKRAYLMESGERIALAYNFLLPFLYGSIKLSALFFYKRVFCIDGLRRIIDYLILASIVLVTIQMGGYASYLFMQCGSHLSLLWAAGVTTTNPPHCWPAIPVFISWVSSNITIDLWILLLPMPSIIKLQVPISKKFSIAAAFLVAFAGFAATVARTVLYYRITYNEPYYAMSHDPGLINTEITYLSMLEAGLSLVAVNMPPLWFLFTSVFLDKPLVTLRSVMSMSPIQRRRSEQPEAAASPSFSAALTGSPILKEVEVTIEKSESTSGRCSLPVAPAVKDIEACRHDSHVA